MTIATATKPRGTLLAITPLDRVLAFGAVAILVAMTAAIVRGRAGWGAVPTLVWPTACSASGCSAKFRR